jgi:hypothetical protein
MALRSNVPDESQKFQTGWQIGKQQAFKSINFAGIQIDSILVPAAVMTY